MSESRNCINGNHSDCTSKSCRCSCHKGNRTIPWTARGGRKSRNCINGNHGDCTDNSCGCRCHKAHSPSPAGNW